MAVANNLVKIIKEGQAQLQVPKTVFYNPIQEFNRDLSVLVLRTYLKHNIWHHKREERHVTSRGGMRILDALSASGLRAIRYAKELGEERSKVKGIVANDLSKAAVELIQQNIELNNLADFVTCKNADANQTMFESSASFDERFHVIDLDPFGTGAQFFDTAVRSIGEAGLLMVTCTDTAVLCGNASESCFARYGSMSMRGEFCHDAALRIILRSLEQHANVYGRYIKPLLSLSVDFYVRLFVQVFTQQAETKLSASKVSQVYLCKECKTHELQPLGTYEIKEDSTQASSENLAVKYKFKTPDVQVGDKCRICDGRFTIFGPIWNGPIHDVKFLELLKQELEISEPKNEFGTFRRIQGLIQLCIEELDVPLFLSATTMASILRMRLPRFKDFMSALVNAGYKVSISHTNQYGLKTNAPNTVVWDVFRQMAEQFRSQQDQSHPGSKKVKLQQTILMERIMSKPRERSYDFTYNAAIETESQKLSLLRFQMNPDKDWGPKSKPTTKT
uniref:tRNA (guanine(26)-N(2))-dimethyltransferase n=1 Tax=Aceria tosichella TaxID=561515 RepID=A0A6G1SPM0_9ACAR